MVKHNGHELETDGFRTRRYRDVRVMRCSRCGTLVKLGMRSRTPLVDQVASLGLSPCPGVRPVVEPSEAPSEARSGVPVEIPSGAIFQEPYRYGEDE